MRRRPRRKIGGGVSFFFSAIFGIWFSKQIQVLAAKMAVELNALGENGFEAYFDARLIFAILRSHARRNWYSQLKRSAQFITGAV